MKKLSFLLKSVLTRTVLTSLSLLIIYISAPNLAIALPPEPLVAIHVSELTQALETAPAVPPTPAWSGTSGYQWWYTSWHYFVAYESLKESLRSDGTPFIEVSDSDIAAGKLRNPDGSPHYPILISLASEAIADNEIAPLRDYVSAGGFLFAGSSAFTRNPDGTTRGDFALASEMGVHLANSSLANWYLNTHFTKRTEHRLTSHIPNGTLLWSAPTHSDQTPWTIFPEYNFHSPHYAWKIVASGAATLADGDAGALLTVSNYGQGQIIYHGVFQPLIGHGGYDPGMYAYLMYRRAIEWAFESFTLPLVKVSPWPYQYDAAMMVRHDFENDQTSIRSIESSAAFEKALGVKGDYYFSTGALREDMAGDTAVIAGLRNAVSSYGATIGSHNGGLKNPSNTSLTPSSYEYWHWGPDEALDSNPPGYASGKAYASASILASFLDIEGWLAGTDNGRTGCGATGSCPRTWVSPFFNSAREDSREVLEQLGAVLTVGEQKISPFPHRTLSYKTMGKYFSMITLPASDWYVGTDIAQSTEYGHTSTSITEAVDFYYNLGALLNIYGHAPSNNGSIQQQYVTYSVTKPRLWSTNSVGINDWWHARAATTVTPTYTAAGNTYTVSSSIAGATDPATAIEVALPKNLSHPISALTVSLNGLPAGTADYRTTDYGIKVLVGSSVSTVNVQYSLQTGNQPPIAVNDAYETTANTPLNQAAPGVLNNDSDPEGTPLTAKLVSAPSHGTLTLNADGSFAYAPAANYTGSDSFTYMANDGTTDGNIAAVTITVLQAPVSAVIDAAASAGSGSLSGPKITAPSLTTKAGNELLLAFIAASYIGAAPNINVTGVSGGGLTWTLVRRTNTQQGTSEIWQAFATTPLTNTTVTANLSKNGAAASITVVAFAGVNVTTPVGAVGGGSAATGSPTASLTTQDANSLVFGVGNDWDGAIARTVGANQTMAYQFLSPTGDTFWVQSQNATVQPAGTVVTINDTAPTNHQWNLSIVEVRASTGVSAPILSSLSLSPATVKGGASSQGTVTLSGSAPSGGVVVSLSDNSSAATVPANVTVLAGTTSAKFTVTTTAVTRSGSATISAAYGGVTKKAVLSITR